MVLVALAGFLLVGIVGTARKKRATFLLWAVGVCLSPFALSLISGELQMQRSCQALPLFAGAALLGGWLLAERWKNRWTKCAGQTMEWNRTISLPTKCTSAGQYLS